MSGYVRREVASLEAEPFGVRIDKFSLVESTGRYCCTVLREGESTWTLEVNGSGEDVDVYLRRDSSAGHDQCVEIQLTVEDRLGVWGLSECRTLHFRGQTDFRRVTSFRKSALNRWWFLPGDTLTVRGQMTVFKEVEKEFGNESEFKNSLGNSTTAWRIVGFLGTCAGIFAARYSVPWVYRAICSCLWYAWVIFALFMLVLVVVYHIFEYLVDKMSGALNRSSKGNSGSSKERSVVPANKEWAVQNSPSFRNRGGLQKHFKKSAYGWKNGRYCEYQESYTYCSSG